jgi:uncharacterized protein (DUF1697 family)
MKKFVKLRDQRDYKEKVKKMLKALYIDCHKKYEKNVRLKVYKSNYRRSSTIRAVLLRCASCRWIRNSSL